MDRDELKVCNCSVCGVLLCGSTHAKYARQHNLQVVAGRILGRPLCPQCIKTDKIDDDLMEKLLGEK